MNQAYVTKPLQNPKPPVEHHCDRRRASPRAAAGRDVLLFAPEVAAGHGVAETRMEWLRSEPQIAASYFGRT